MALAPESRGPSPELAKPRPLEASHRRSERQLFLGPVEHLVRDVVGVELNMGDVQFYFPVKIRVLIKDQLFGTIEASPVQDSSSLLGEFDFSPFVCSQTFDNRIIGQVALEQVLPKTFAGPLTFKLLSDFDKRTCSDTDPLEICACTAEQRNGDFDSGQLAVAQPPLMTVAIAETDEARARLSNQNEQALLELRCLKQIRELEAKEVEIMPETVPEECWGIPQLGFDLEALSGRATSSVVQAVD